MTGKGIKLNLAAGLGLVVFIDELARFQVTRVASFRIAEMKKAQWVMLDLAVLVVVQLHRIAQCLVGRRPESPGSRVRIT